MQSTKRNNKKLIICVTVVCLIILLSGIWGILYIYSGTDTKESMQNKEIIQENAQTKEEDENEENRKEELVDSVMDTPNSQIDCEDEERTSGVQDDYDFSSIEMKNFKADTYDIYINTDKDVTFTVEIYSEKYSEIDGITVCDSEGQLVTSMNDKGVDGDTVAGDSIYTGRTTLSSPEIKVLDYFATIGNIESNTFEICYYRDIEQDEFASFVRLKNKITAMEFEDACNYVENSDEIKLYVIDKEKKLIDYQSIYGIHGIWQDLSDANIKGSGQYAVPSELGCDYEAVENMLDEVIVIPQGLPKDIIVLRPFRGSQFQYDDFEIVGKLLEKSLGKSLTVVDDDAVTLSVMQSLDEYDVVLIDSHGTLSKVENSPYIVIGEELNEWSFFRCVKYSADLFGGRIRCAGNYLAVGSDFFDKYYSENSLNDAYWFLGTCYSIYNNEISDTLVQKGADAVVGFSDVVNIEYCNSILYEMTLNSMLLSADNLLNSYLCATEIYGIKDPDNPNTETHYKGQDTYKFVKLIKKRADGEVIDSESSASETEQIYWVIFREGFRDERIELSAFSIEYIGNEQVRVIWDEGLYVESDAYVGECSQYYYISEDNWEFIGTYDVLSDWATEVLYSNVDIYDTHGNLVLKASDSNEVVKFFD